MQQIVKGRATTVGYIFERSGTNTNPSPDATTVTVSRNGVVIGDVDQEADDLGVGQVGLRVVPGVLGVLRFDWTATFDGEAETFSSYCEVVGDYYFSTSEIRTRYPELADVPADQIATARAEAEETIEGLGAKAGAHVAFVHRAETFTYSGDGSTRLGIPRYKVTEVLDCTVDGEVVPPAELRVAESSVYRSSSWPEGEGNIILTVAHGYHAPPFRIRSAAMLLAKELLINGPIDARASQLQTEQGGLITLALPGRAGYVTGIPEVDAAVDQFGRPPIKATSVVLGDRANRYRGS